MYIETKGPTLEEIAKIFDGEDATVARVEVGEDGVVEGKVQVLQVEKA